MFSYNILTLAFLSYGMATAAGLTTTATMTTPSTTSTAISTGSTLSNVFTTSASGSLASSLTAPTGSATAPVVPGNTSVPAAPKEYYLFAKSIDGSHQYDGMYVGAWQIGANTTDAILTNKRKEALKFYLNGTEAMADLAASGLPWSLQMANDVIGSEWTTVNINAKASGFGSFWFNSTGLQWTPLNTAPPHNQTWENQWDNFFGGWRVCKWWHGVPQLFYIWSNSRVASVSSCEDVLLYAQYF